MIQSNHINILEWNARGIGNHIKDFFNQQNSNCLYQ